MDDLTGKKKADGASGSVAGQADIRQIVGRTEDVPSGILMMVVATVLFAGTSRRN